jgi:hypothetical protein
MTVNAQGEQVIMLVTAAHALWVYMVYRQFIYGPFPLAESTFPAIPNKDLKSPFLIHPAAHFPE